MADRTSSDPIGEKPRDIQLHRDAVGTFAAAMIAKLDANREKVSWRQQGMDELVRRLGEEVDELHDALGNSTADMIREECVDVGAMAMMIFDLLAPAAERMGGSQPTAQVDLADDAPAYTVEPVKPACSECGADHGFDVIGPDGVALGTTFGDMESAEYMADDLNSAYAQGRAATTAVRAPQPEAFPIGWPMGQEDAAVIASLRVRVAELEAELNAELTSHEKDAEHSAQRAERLLREIGGDLPTDEMHPNGRCRCAGEGKCLWCTRSRVAELEEAGNRFGEILADARKQRDEAVRDLRHATRAFATDAAQLEEREAKALNERDKERRRAGVMLNSWSECAELKRTALKERDAAREQLRALAADIVETDYAFEDDTAKIGETDIMTVPLSQWRKLVDAARKALEAK